MMPMKKEPLAPKFCVLEILEACILKCKMCGNWKRKEYPSELTIEEWKKFILCLRNQIGTEMELNIAGGEPLYKKGILDLVSFSTQQGFKVIMVSNAYLIDEIVAKEIAKSGLSYLGISLDSLNEETHDLMRGVKGVYSRAMKAIDYLAKFKTNNLSIGLQTIIMKGNLDEIVEIVRWAEQDDRLGSIYFQAIVQPNFSSSETEWLTDNEWYNRSEFRFLWPDDINKVYSVIDELIRFKKEGFKIANPLGQLESFKRYFEDPRSFSKSMRCNKGNYILIITYSGDIYLCHKYELLGNIRNVNLNMEEIWRSELANGMRKRMNNCQKYCGPLVNCYYEK